MIELKIIFPNEKMREVFATWLSDGGGEQDYYRLCETEIEDGSKDVGLPNCHYHGPENEEYPENDARRYGKFLCDNTIRVTLHESP